MKYVLAMVVALGLVGCGEPSREKSMSDQEIQDAQKRVKELEQNAPAPPPK